MVAFGLFLDRERSLFHLEKILSKIVGTIRPREFFSHFTRDLFGHAPWVLVKHFAEAVYPVSFDQVLHPQDHLLAERFFAFGTRKWQGIFVHQKKREVGIGVFGRLPGKFCFPEQAGVKTGAKPDGGIQSIAGGGRPFGKIETKVSGDLFRLFISVQKNFISGMVAPCPDFREDGFIVWIIHIIF
jgi:hypothetical protein